MTQLTPVSESLMWKIINETLFDFHFQPVVDLKSRRVTASEMLLRPRRDSGYTSPDQLFTAARELQLQGELDLACIQAAVRRAASTDVPSHLSVHININSDTIADLDHLQRLQVLLEQELSHAASRKIIIELTEKEPLFQPGVEELVRMCKRLGVSIALDDFGVGHSNLNAWLAFKPEIVKIDRYFIQNLANDTARQELLRGMRQMSEIMGTRLLAEGVETADELKVARSLGIHLAQGFFLARPHPAPVTETRREALDVFQDSRVIVTASPGRTQQVDGMLFNLVKRMPSLPATATARDVVQFFSSQETQPSVVLTTDDGRPAGIMNMASFMNLMAQPYRMDIYGTRPAIGLCNKTPVVKDVNASFDELVGILTEADQRYLADGIVVTERGRYMGLCSSHQLIQRVTENRIEAARHANPLTLLPGNMPITTHVERMMDSSQDFALAYADLNNFKAFNDCYGFWKGDEVILLAAKTINEFVDPLYDFVGHVGGDDFVLVLQSPDWRDRLRSIVDESARRIGLLYPDKDRQAGGHEAEDRFGVKRFFPLVTLSFGVVPISGERSFGMAEVVSSVAEAKKQSKTTKGNIYVHLPGFSTELHL